MTLLLVGHLATDPSILKRWHIEEAQMKVLNYQYNR